MSFETISVVGLGYIGLPTAAMFASKKKKVVGVDVNQNAIDTINQGKIHIVEPELDILVNAAVTENYLSATSKPIEADAFLIAVPTPFKDDHEPDLSYIEDATRAIAKVLRKGNLIILESTSPVGTTEKIVEWLSQERSDLNFPGNCPKGEFADVYVAHCPERVLPGHVVRELVENDRVIGGITPECSKKALELYKIFVEGNCIVTDARTAEMAKLTENAFRDVNIAFANELSLICDELDINVWELIQLANRHPRVNILQPGPGVGGHCIAVDPWFIVSKSPERANLIRTARQVNDCKPDWVIEKVKDEISKFLSLNGQKAEKQIKVALYGLAFKANIDDLRESPAVSIALNLSESISAEVVVVEPNITQLPQSLAHLSLLEYEECKELADIHVILVEHEEFIENGFHDLSHVLDTKGISDRF